MGGRSGRRTVTRNRVMRNRSIAGILLFLFGCGLLAGPHPCRARTAASGATAGCHETARPAGPAGLSAPPVGGDCCRHDRLCEATCQTMAILRPSTPKLAIQPLAPLVTVSATRH